MPNYNAIAPYYDGLKRRVFGQSLILAQSHFFTLLPKKSHVLIIGGGSGKILEQLDAIGFNGSIDFIEKSSVMINRAEKRNFRFEVNFLRADIFEIQLEVSYDFIITSYFLDQFGPKSLDRLIAKLSTQLMVGRCWLDTDFRNSPKVSHKILLKIMYIFFKITTGIESCRLYEPDKWFEKYSLELENQTFFYNNWICSKVYKKLKPGQ